MSTAAAGPSPGSPRLLDRPVARAVWSVSWPMVALGLIRSAYFLTDSYWVGRLGDAPLAALGGSAFAWWMIFLACGLAPTGAHALAARHEGAGQRVRIGATLVQGLWVAAGVALLLAFVAHPLRGGYFRLLGFDPAGPEFAQGMAFLGASLLGASTLAAANVLDSAFRGLGETRTALVITAATLLANAALDPLLIWGWGPLPGLGIAGAAWATAAANGLGAVAAFVVLRRRGLHLPFRRPELRAMRRIVKIGAPVTAAGVGFSLVYVLLGRIITDFGTHQMAALGVGHRIEGMAYMIGVGFSVGASTMVGQHLGAGDPERAAASAWAAAKLAGVPMLLMGAVFFGPAPRIFALFTDDPATIAAGVVYLRIQCTVYAFMGIESVLTGAFAGAGDTIPSFWITAIGTGLRLPAAWLLAYPLGLGIAGVWIAIAVSTFGKAVVLALWFRRRAWVGALEPDEDA